MTTVTQIQTPSRRRNKGEGMFRIRADGRYEYRFDVRMQGPKRVQKSVYGKTKKECLWKAAEGRDAERRGILVTGPRQTFAAYLDQWLDDHIKPNRAPKTDASYRQQIRLHIRPALGHLPIGAITPAHLDALHRAKREAGLSPRSVQIVHGIIRGALNRAVRQGIIAVNPCSRIDQPRAKRPDIKPLSHDEAARFLDSAATDRLSALWLMALHSGLRQGELLGLRWQDVDLDRRTMTLTQTIQTIEEKIETDGPKSRGSRRTLPIPEPVLDALRRWKARQAAERLRLGPAWTESGLVFTSTVGTPLYARNVSRRFHQLLDASGIERRGMHTTRHTTATLLLRANEHPKVVQELLGHASIALTMDTYSHVMPGMKEAATETLARLLAPNRGAKETKSGG